MDLRGKVALVTGAGRGIGRGCALALAARGCALVVNDRPGSPDLAETTRAARDLGVDCHPIEGDAFERAGCESIVAEAIGHAREVHYLVSNPAFSRRGDFLEYEPETFERVIQGTLVGGFHTSQLFARHRVERGGGGAMVFVSSVHAHMPYGRSVAYNAAKAGLNHMMRTIAAELLRHRIRANAIEPGWIDTPGERETFGDAFVETEGRTMPLGRIGAPDDIGRAAAYLLSDEADYVTGAVLRVDGGYVIKECAEGD